MASQQSLRKALGAIKDSTSVSLANLNSEFKELDVAVVKATSHIESPPKEKHIMALFAATSSVRPRADVAYCIHALARRLAKTHNWTVALKTLIVFHRLLREGDPTFRDEFLNYCGSRGQILNMSYFKDDSSSNAWDYSAWVRTYSLFLEERLECFRVLKYDVQKEKMTRTKELDTTDLLEQLPALQQLLHRFMGCRPEGAAMYNRVIHYALNLVLKESVKLYQAISDGIINLVDKFFEMQRHEALRAFDIYKKAGQQTEKLSAFYDACKGFDSSRSLDFPPLEQPPQSFISAMEDYVRDAPQQSTAVRKDLSGSGDGKVQLALEYKKAPEPEETPVIEAPTVPEPTPKQNIPPVQSNDNVDLLGFNDPSPDPSALDESNSLALAIIPSGTTANGSTQNTNPSLDLATSGTTGWELALVETQSSNTGAITESKLAGGFDQMVLSSLYDDAMRRPIQSVQATYGVSYSPNPHESPAMLQAAPQQDPFYASSKVAPPPSVQMAALQQQQHAMMMHQQMMGVHPGLNQYNTPVYGMPYSYPPPAFQPQTQYSNNPFGNAGML